LNCQLQGQLHDDISYHGDVNTLRYLFNIYTRLYLVDHEVSFFLPTFESKEKATKN